MTTHTNWSGNLAYAATHVAEPATVAEAQQIVRATEKLRVVGSRHCFNDIADTPATHLSLAKMRNVLNLDKEKRTLTLEGGARYGDFGKWLHGEGWAVHNLASLPHISVPGAVATATHGSGMKLGNLATGVIALTFIDAKGDLVTLSREKNPDVFPGVVVNLGALGVVVSITLAIEPAFHVRQDVYVDVPFAAVETNFDAIMGSGDSVSLFTSWHKASVDQLWVKRRTTADDRSAAPGDLQGARLATENMHPLAGLSAINCTDQMGAPGPAYARMPHFKMEFTPSSGEELQAEYFVARERAAEGIRALRKIGGTIAPLLMISEVRTIAADDLWLSTAYKQDVVAFHFTCKRDVPGVMALLPHIEAALAPLSPRPHWGKLFTMAPEKVRAGYPRLADFRALMAQHDPKGKFRNGFVEKYVGA